MSIFFLLLISLQLSAAVNVGSSHSIEFDNIGNIVIAGMIIVFASLVVILIFVSLLQYVEGKEKKTKSGQRKKQLTISSITPGKKQKKHQIDHQIQLAAITTIFLYETEIEKRSQMLLTMKRAKVSAWQESARLLMPNYAYSKKMQSK